MKQFEYPRDFKGVWIPAEIYLDERLTPGEKILLAEIDSLDRGEGCHASNVYLRKFCKISSGTLINSLKKLSELGLITAAGFKNRCRVWKVTRSKSDQVLDQKRANYPIKSRSQSNTTEKNNEKVAADPAFTRCLRFFYDNHKDIYKVAPKWGAKEAKLLKADIERLRGVGESMGEDWQKMFDTFVLGFLKNGFNNKMASFADSAGHGYNVFHGLLEQMIYDFVQYTTGG